AKTKLVLQKSLGKSTHMRILHIHVHAPLYRAKTELVLQKSLGNSPSLHHTCADVPAGASLASP
ncbi:9430_t:CDS:2, partial [Dentiscutata heterogama]